MGAGGDDLDADYAKAGFGGHLRFGQRPALLVVDVVAAYLDPASPLYLGGAEAVACFARLIAACRACSSIGPPSGPLERP